MLGNRMLIHAHDIAHGRKALTSIISVLLGRWKLVISMSTTWY